MLGTTFVAKLFFWYVVYHLFVLMVFLFEIQNLFLELKSISPILTLFTRQVLPCHILNLLLEGNICF